MFIFISHIFNYIYKKLLFKLYEDTPSSVPELYLEILNLQLEMPDMARLEKPAKPPVPQVSIKTYYSSEILIIMHSSEKQRFML